jgi:DNA ligase D-like protein (predicted polymerase)
VRTVPVWADASKREVSYALCNDRRTLLWFANQRAVEYHPALVRAGQWDHPTHLILDIDPPSADAFGLAVRAALLVREALAEAGLAGAVKTSGAKGVHVFVPLAADVRTVDVAAATRALSVRAERLDPALATTAFIREDREGKVFIDSTRAGGATVVAAYSPRLRPGVPVSFPVPWDDLDRVTPADFTVHTAARLLAGADPWADLMPAPQSLSTELIEEGHTIPVARVQAMHEGKRRARARRGLRGAHLLPGGEQGAQRVLELLCCGFAQRAEEPPLSFVGGPGRRGQRFPAGGGQLDDVLAPVAGVRVALHESFLFQRVDQRHHCGPVDAQPARGFLLRHRVRPGQAAEHGQFPAVDSVRLQRRL